MTESGPTGDGQQDWVYHVAAQLAAADLSQLGPSKRPRKRKALIAVAGGVVAVLFAAVIAFAVTRGRGSDDDVASGPAASPAPVTDPAVPVAETAASSTPDVASTVAEANVTTSVAEAAPEPASTEPASTEPASTEPQASDPAATEPPTTEAAATSQADPNALPVRWAEYTNGGVILGGRVPDQATADEIAARAAAVVGAGNVHVEYSIDPSAPRPDSAPLYVRDSILFASGRAELNATARDTLDLGVLLLNLYPQVTFDISGHTDSVGSEESNLALSQRRIDAIVAYLEANGIDASRLTSVAKGEADPIASNDTPEGRAANRRIEIQINNFLG